MFHLATQKLSGICLVHYKLVRIMGKSRNSKGQFTSKGKLLRKTTEPTPTLFETEVLVSYVRVSGSVLFANDCTFAM